jgi:Protein of unknown function (DUF3237)
MGIAASALFVGFGRQVAGRLTYDAATATTEAAMTRHVPKAELVFQLQVICNPPTPLGTINGGMAMMIPIIGGTVSGARLTGEVLPGGADWAIRRADGRFTVDARYAIKAADGTIIQVFNGCTNALPPPRDAAPPVLVTSPRFIAPEGPHEWLNFGVFVGTLVADPNARNAPIEIGIFQVA